MKPEDLELLVTRQMPFGKYKGRLLADLPGNYLAWFAREGFPQGELGRLLALMLELDHNGAAQAPSLAVLSRAQAPPIARTTLPVPAQFSHSLPSS